MSGSPRRYVPALDGLRAVAVLLVFGFHSAYGRYLLAEGRFRGGYLGVDVFFVLSGFLITSIVLSYPDLTRAAVADFYERRIRRLLPALLGAVTACAALAVFVQHGADSDATLRSIPGALGYWTNIVAATADQPKTTMLAHTWSLALEFQFYLVWPVVLLVLKRWLRPLQLLLFTVALVQVAAVWRAVLVIDGASFERVYFGPDTRFDSLLTGAALALYFAWKPQRRSAVVRWMSDAAALAAGCVVIALAMTTRLETLWLFERGGLTLVAILSMLVIHGVLVEPAGLAAAVLRWRPLVYLGKISYSFYLWHWPVIFVTGDLEPHWSFAALTAVRAVVSLALAAMSYHLVERAVRPRPASAPIPRATLWRAALAGRAA